MKIHFYPCWQIGLMIDFGTTYEKRKYVCLDIPFLTIQFCWFKPREESNQKKRDEKPQPS